MHGTLGRRLRLAWRGVRRGRQYPVLLPHAAGGAGELVACDGTRRLGEAARASRSSRWDLLTAHEEGKLILWPWPIAPEPEAHAAEGPVEVIILSPHPDDAALSACSWLLSRRGRCLLLDAFTRTAWWRLEGPADAEVVRRTREAEERLVARLAGARLEILGLPEALLRGVAMEDIFTAPEDRAEDAEVRGEVKAAVERLARAHPRATWIVPLGVGGHLDHRIARDAALDALAGSGGAKVEFYEDLPYAADVGGVPDFSGHLAGRGRLKVGSRMTVDGRKLELNRVYHSQFTWSALAKVMEYARRVGGGRAVERTWRFEEAVGGAGPTVVGQATSARRLP